MNAMASHVFCGSEDLRIVGESFGDPTGMPVLFLHGGGQTRHSWNAACHRMAERDGYALAVDTRGHGDSDWSPSGDYTMDRLSADLRRIIDQWGVKPVVVGASLGGLTALVTEGESPGEYLAGLILVDIAHRIEAAGFHRIMAFMTAHPDGFASLESAADAISAYLPHRPRPRSLDGLKKNLRPTSNGRFVWHWDPKLLALQDTTRAHRMARLRNAACHLSVPTLLIRGRESDVVSEEVAQEFLQLAPHAQFEDVSKAHHMLVGDNNDAFNDVVFRFLHQLQ